MRRSCPVCSSQVDAGLARCGTCEWTAPCLPDQITDQSLIESLLDLHLQIEQRIKRWRQEHPPSSEGESVWAGISGHGQLRERFMSLEHRDETMRRVVDAAQRGEASAQWSLSDFYQLRAVYDQSEAVKWCRKAAEQGHRQAQYDLGYAYAHGRGLPEDPSRHRV